jgi:O-antigen ligase
MFKGDVWLKFEKYLFYIFIFSIPFQTRVFLGGWGEPKDEFYSLFFYFTDALILILLFSWIFRIIFLKFEGGFTCFLRKIFSKWQNKILFLFLFFISISIFRSDFYSFGFYHFLKFIEFAFIFLYLKSNMGWLGFKKTLAIFVFSGITQSFLGMFQFFTQGSLGLRYFGETLLSPFLDGVAKIDTADGKIMRPYGTFTHPNVLAAFLFLSLSFFYYLVISKARRFDVKNMYIFLVLLSGLFLTFSRSIWIVFAVFSFILFIKLPKNKDIKKMFFSSIAIFFFLGLVFSNLVFARINVSSGDEGVNFRHIYENTAFDFLSESPVLGVGVGNFVNTFKKSGIFGENVWTYQPVHNFYLLMASEIGLFGFVVFLLFLALILRSIKFSEKQNSFKILFLGIAFSIFLLFLTDHYFWDLQQGALMLWVFLGLVAGVAEKNYNENSEI